MHMKTRLFLTTLLAILIASLSYAQINPASQEYESLKLSGGLPVYQQVDLSGPITTIVNTPNRSSSATSCLLIPLDVSTFSFLDRNDDLSTNQISFPFNFDFYGAVQNSCWINNNGNVSFDGPYSTYSATGFPINGFPMLAPFWADVDTRNTGSGLMWYKVEPHRVIVIWDAVGYFSAQVDKLNTFELIFTDGTDPLVGLGNNVAFSYDDMQWTTGSASAGVNGFGGVPSTVGVNKGDGSVFALVGRFDHEGIDYDGPGGISDGVSYLDCKNFFFNTTTNSNIPPVASGFPVSTVTVNVGDVWNYSVQFLSPELGQTTTTIVNDGGLSGFTYLNTSGNVSQIDMHFTGSNANVGTHTIVFSATDDGIPSGVTTVYLEINVVQPACTDPTNSGEIGNSQSSCFDFDPDAITSISSPTGYTGTLEYLWQYSTDMVNFSDIANSNSETFDPGLLSQTTWFKRIARVDCMPDWSGAAVSNVVEMTVNTIPTVEAGLDATIYIGYPPYAAQLNAVGEGTGTYLWSPAIGLSDPTISNPLASPLATTTYTVTFTDENGCLNSDMVTVTAIDVRCGKNMDKVLICHIPPGNPGKAKTLCIGFDDVANHLAHGDYLGSCITNNDNIVFASAEITGVENLSVNVSPNPFVGKCDIEISLKESSYVTLQVYDFLGKPLGNIFEGNLEEGQHTFIWNNSYSSNSSSIFYLVVKTSKEIKTVKLLENNKL